MKPFKLLVLVFCFAFMKVNAQAVYCPPANIGFESGNFSNWTCYIGNIDKDGNIVVTENPPTADRQTLYDASSYTQIDPFGKFPTLCPYGGKYSIRLGNQDTGKGAERVSYNFTVPPSANEYDMIFYYAVVLQNPPHRDFQQPRFTVRTFDVTDQKYVDCASFNFIAANNLPGFKMATDTVFYKDWAPSTIHLKGYAGKVMSLEFTTNDCSLGRHFGYAYIDVNEDCGSLISGNSYCSNQNSATLVAPGGFGTYAWYPADFSKQISSGQTLTLSPPPPDGTRYAAILTPFDGLGCTDTVFTTVNRLDVNLIFNVPDTLRGCVGTGVDLTSPSVTAGSAPNLQLSYYTDQYGLNYLFQPQKILTDGTYYIKAVSPAGCTAVKPVYVVVANPALAITQPAAVNYPATVDMSTTFTHNSSYNYGYFNDSTAKAPVVDYQHIAHTGTYYVRAVNSTGCITTKPVNVTVVPPPPPTITIPNTFTPNNDGINDLFSISIAGYGAFESISVYNRFGQLMFETKNEDTHWDGKFNGKPAAVGTYYWVFEGRNTYYNTKIKESGFITLIR